MLQYWLVRTKKLNVYKFLYKLNEKHVLIKKTLSKVFSASSEVWIANVERVAAQTKALELLRPALGGIFPDKAIFNPSI